MARRTRKTPPPEPAPSHAVGGWAPWAAAGLIVVAGMAAYANSLDGPLIFDDLSQISTNPAIQQFWPPWAILAESTRPLGTLTFAANYALGGLNVRGYHVVNLAIHLAAGLVLFDLVRRTLSRGRGTTSLRADAALPLALTVGLLWTLHPLQTAAVTYIVQRLESLMSLFYLLTLYGFLRAQDSRRPGAWYAASVACCALGMATKEIMVTAPLAVLWYDRVFVAASWADVRRRTAYYAALAGTWLVLAGIMLVHVDSYTAGGVFIVPKVSPLAYALNQPGVIAHYLHLLVWPKGLCLDYGWPVATSAAEIVPPLLAIGGLLGLTAWGLVRRHAVGFLSGCFFLILAPTSSVAPIKDLAFDHRMYLASAAVVTAVVLAGYRLGQRLQMPRWLGAMGVAVAAITLGTCTAWRNADYHTSLAIWADTVAKRPQNARARGNYGAQLADAGQTEEALRQYRISLDLDPRQPTIYYNLGKVHAGLGQIERSIAEYETALSLKPDYLEAHNNLANVLAQHGRSAAAATHFEKALAINPRSAEVHNNLGNVFDDLGRPEKAMEHYRLAVALRPGYLEAEHNLGEALADRGEFREALEHLGRALDLALAQDQRALAADLRSRIETYRARDARPRMPAVPDYSVRPEKPKRSPRP